MMFNELLQAAQEEFNLAIEADDHARLDDAIMHFELAKIKCQTALEDVQIFIDKVKKYV